MHAKHPVRPCILAYSHSMGRGLGQVQRTGPAQYIGESKGGGGGARDASNLFHFLAVFGEILAK